MKPAPLKSPMAAFVASAPYQGTQTRPEAQEAAPSASQEPIPPEDADAPLTRPDLGTLRTRKPSRKEATTPLNLRIPVSLHEDLKNIAFLADMSMTDIIVKAVRAEAKRMIEKLNKGE